MSPSDFAILRDQLKHDEGTGPQRNGRFFPYVDTVGKITLGYGRNLSDNGISGAEASAMLDHDIEMTMAALTLAHPDVLTIDATRQIVLGNLAFNMGVPTLNTFHQMWAKLVAGDYEGAALEMIESKWSTQVGARATRLAEAMRTGELK